jgi:hypothetical protein
MITKDQIKNYMKSIYPRTKNNIFSSWALDELKELTIFISCVETDITPYPFTNGIILMRCYNAYITSKMILFNYSNDTVNSYAEFWKMMYQISINDYDSPELTKIEIHNIISCVMNEILIRKTEINSNK